MRSILFVLAALSLSACSGAAAGGTFNNPFHQAEQVLTAPPYDGHVRWFSSWQDTRPETRAFTNAITINVDCDDPDAVTHAQQILDNGHARSHLVRADVRVRWGRLRAASERRGLLAARTRSDSHQ
jgi:hypothetical protein